MNTYLIFWATFAILLFLIMLCDLKYNMLRDNSTSVPKPYSFSRVQLSWWTLIVIASFISTMIIKHQIPTFNESTLYLLGISSATTATATIIDLGDQNNPALTLSQNSKASTFFLDILSDKNGVSIHRLQTVLFNTIFGIWFIITVLKNLNDSGKTADDVIPVITPNNLILLGLSSGLYAVLKATENKQKTS